MGKILKTYDYVDENGVLLFQVVRDDKKDFYPRRPNTIRDPKEPAWLYGLGEVRRVLYRLPEVMAAKTFGHTIFVVEGEKDADSVAGIGLVATTNPGGVGMGWTDFHADLIKGAKHVVILPDNDIHGKNHAEKVRSLLQGKVEKVRIVELPNLPPKGDVSDWIQAGGDKETLISLSNQGPTSKGWRTAKDLLNEGLSDVDWIVENIFARPSLSMVSGDADAFKSWSMTLLCMSAAAGWKWLSKFPVDAKKAMLISADEDHGETARKISWLSNGSGSNEKDVNMLGENLLVWTNDMPFDDDSQFASLLDDISDFKPDILVVDHLRVTFDGEENSSEFARKIKMRGRSIHRVHPCAVIWIHHFRKLSKEREQNVARQRVRGTGGLVQAFDHHIAFEREEDNDVAIVTVDRQKKGRRLPPFTIKARFVDQEDMATVEYMGDHITESGTSSAPGSVLSWLRDNPGPHGVKDVEHGLKDLSRMTIKRALSKLERDRLTMVTGTGRGTTHEARPTPDWAPQMEIGTSAHNRHDNDEPIWKGRNILGEKE